MPSGCRRSSAITPLATSSTSPTVSWAAMMSGHLGPPDRTEIESRAHGHVPAALEAKGHGVVICEPWASSMGHAHAIEIIRDAGGAGVSFAAGSDPRSEGVAAAW